MSNLIKIFEVKVPQVKKSLYSIIIALIFQAPFMHVSAQIQVLDTFNRANNNVVGLSWVETETLSPSSDSISNTFLKMGSTTAGRDYTTWDVSSKYNTVFNSNTATLTWAFNMRQSRPDPSGFDPSNYGIAFILGGTTPSLASGNGYAVVLGNSGTSDNLRLVRYANGLVANANITTIISNTNDYGADYLTVRVTYNPVGNNWSLYVGNNLALFDDPALATYTQIGTTTSDATYTGSDLLYLSCLWNHATGSTESGIFDNILIPSTCVPLTEPTVQTSALNFASIGANSITLNYTRGNGTNCIIIAKQGGAVTTTPIDGTTYIANTVFGSGTNVAPNEYVVYMGAANSVNITGLNPTTAYYFQIFEYNGIGCTTNFLITPPCVGSATTLSCVIAGQPTIPSSGLTASTILASSLNLNWTRGNGAYCMVVGRAILPISTPPADGTGYTANATFGLGSTTAPAEFVLYSGTGNNVLVTGLNPNTQYYFSVYEFNGIGCTANYFTSSLSSINATTLNVASYNYYYGTMHSHSDYSDGDLDNVCNGANSAYCCYDIGNTALNFDFMGISDHNHNEGPVMTLAKYASGIAEATSYNSTHTDFAALYGMEWGTISTGGHVTVYGINQLIGWNAGNYNIYCAKGDYNSLFNLIANTPGAYATLCHPNNTDFGGLFNNPYNAIYDNAMVGIALRNGPYNSLNTSYSDPSTWSNLWFYQTLLSKGYHLGPTCDLDNHNSATMGKSSQQRTAILGTALSKASVNDAMLNMRFYATDDYNAQVSFDINTTFIMGNIASQFADPTIHVTVTDGNGESTDSIRIYYGVPGSNVLPTMLTFVKNSSALTFTHAIAPGSTYYYYAEIRQPDGNKIWTAPIWFTKLLTNPLPLNLLHFEGKNNNGFNLLTWCTATEIMTDYFVLEKSIDGINFTPIANIDAAGFSLQPSNYAYKDYEKSSTVNYYLLQQFYVDGNSDFSNVIVIADDSLSNQVQIYPNPTQGVFNIIYAHNPSSTFNVRITDSKGKTVFEQTKIQDQYLNCSLLNTAPGIYTITVYDDTISFSQNLILKN